jgi:predicted ATPase with chaperone activity
MAISNTTDGCMGYDRRYRIAVDHLASAMATRHPACSPSLFCRPREYDDLRFLTPPYHTLSDEGLIGGGQVPMPGEVSLAHHGVLLLDELPECRRHILVLQW